MDFDSNSWPYGHTYSPNPNPRAPYEIRRIGGGGELAVSLDEMLLDLRADSDDENETVERLIRGATDFFEGRTGWRLTPAIFELLVGGCSQQITVERGPFRQLLGAWWWDSSARDWVLVDPLEYTVIERGREFDLLFSEAALSDFPAPSSLRPRPIRIQFEAGFDSPEVTGTTVQGPPEDGMVISLKALVAAMYETREAGALNPSDPSKDFLLMQYRKFW